MDSMTEDETLDGDGETGWRVVEQRSYDREIPDDLTTVIIESVAAVEGVEMTAIKEPSLYDVVNTSAIGDSFFGPMVSGERRDSVGTVHFLYRGHRVTVRSDGWVQVADRNGDDGASGRA